MPRTIEELQGIHGTFVLNKVRKLLGFRNRAVATGQMTYRRQIGEQTQTVVVPVKNVLVRRLGGKDAHDLRRYVRITRGPKHNRDKIIGLIDLN